MEDTLWSPAWRQEIQEEEILVLWTKRREQVRDKGWGCGRGRASRSLCREGPHWWSLPPALRTGSKFTGPAGVRWGRPRAAQYINIFNE